MKITGALQSYIFNTYFHLYYIQNIQKKYYYTGCPAAIARSNDRASDRKKIRDIYCFQSIIHKRNIETDAKVKILINNTRRH